jgi:hypothetical protein
MATQEFLLGNIKGGTGNTGNTGSTGATGATGATGGGASAPDFSDPSAGIGVGQSCFLTMGTSFDNSADRAAPKLRIGMSLPSGNIGKGEYILLFPLMDGNGELQGIHADVWTSPNPAGMMPGNYRITEVAFAPNTINKGQPIDLGDKIPSIVRVTRIS